MEPHIQDALLLSTLQQFNEVFIGCVLIPAYIVTITLCYKTSFSCKDTDLLFEKFKDWAFTCDAEVSELKQFKNSIQINIKQNDQNMAVKVFSNGSIHFTGVKCLVDAFIVVQSIVSALGIMFHDRFNIISNQILMINITFKLNKTFDMDCTFNHMLDLAIINSDISAIITYDKKKHAAIKIKSNLSTIMLFKSGSVLVSGCKQFSHILDSANSLASLLPP